MAVPKPDVLTVRSRIGKIVHSTTYGSALAGRTHCGRSCEAWVVVDPPVTCRTCAAAVAKGSPR